MAVYLNNGEVIKNRFTKYLPDLTRRDVIVNHVRGRNEDGSISNKGGITSVSIFLPDGTCYNAEAKCHPNDNFNRRVGTLIALGKALKQAACPREEEISWLKVESQKSLCEPMKELI